MNQSSPFLKTPTVAGKFFCLVYALIGCAFLQSAVAQTAPEAVTLEIGKTIEREIGGEQKHSYQIFLSANQYAHIALEQHGIDMEARLTDADGKTLVSFDAEMRPNRPEKFEYVAKADGIYRLEVQPVYKLLPAGRYEIKLVEISPAKPVNDALLESRTLYSEASRAWAAGEYDEARAKVERVIEMRLQTVGAENRTTLTSYTLLARIQKAQGKYDESLQTNLRVLAVREKILEPDHPDIAMTLDLVGTDYSYKEDFQNAILYYNRALTLREKVFGRNHPVTAASLVNLGTVYESLGDRLKTEELYLQALAIQEKSVGELDNNTGVVLYNLGKTLVDIKEYEKAEPFLRRALAIFEKLYSPEHPKVLGVLATLAVIPQNRGELDQARAIYERVLATQEKTLGANHPETGFTVLSLAHLAMLKGENEHAEVLFRRALQIWEESYGPESSTVSLALNGLALLLAQKGDIKQAVQIQKRAAAIDERGLNLNLAIGSERQKIAYLEKISEQTNQNIFLQIRFASAEPEAVELAATTVLRQKGRVMDALSNNLIELRRRFDPADQKLIDRLNGTTTELAGLILDGREDAPLAEYNAKIKTLTDEREKLEDDISRRAAGLYTKSQSVTLDAVQSLIPANTALVEFAVYTPVESDLTASIRKSGGDEPRYAAYILRNDGVPHWKDIGETKEINRILEDYRAALRDPKRKDVKILARAADEKIMQPVRSVLGEIRQLLVSPDGDLNLIPFEALVDEQNRYLIENYSFTYLTSGRDLLRMQTVRKNDNKSLIVANPTFGEPGEMIAANTKNKPDRRRRRGVNVARDLSETYFTPLGATGEEARSIQTLFPDATFLIKDQATESALKQTAAPRILHIATHGFFLEDAGASTSAVRGAKAVGTIENPLVRSGLALAGANRRDGKPDDGILTALEAANLNLWGTKLVVLSACDTGVGEVKNGEGVYGLRRAFVLAGAESLVMSLWAVSDSETRRLMADYYKNLKTGMGRGAALRQAQIAMMKKDNFQHPFYWAAFIQSGEWANLAGKR